MAENIKKTIHAQRYTNFICYYMKTYCSYCFYSNFHFIKYKLFLKLISISIPKRSEKNFNGISTQSNKKIKRANLFEARLESTSAFSLTNCSEIQIPRHVLNGVTFASVKRKKNFWLH